LSSANVTQVAHASGRLEQRRKVQLYRNPDFERVVEGLRKARLPEQ